MTNISQKEFQAWGKLGRQLDAIDSDLRGREITPTAARKKCVRAVHNFWNTISQVRGIKAGDLDRTPVSPYRFDPLTGADRGLHDPLDPMEVPGVTLGGYESNEERIQRLVRELTSGS